MIRQVINCRPATTLSKTSDKETRRAMSVKREDGQGSGSKRSVSLLASKRSRAADDADHEEPSSKRINVNLRSMDLRRSVTLGN